MKLLNGILVIKNRLYFVKDGSRIFYAPISGYLLKHELIRKKIEKLQKKK